MANPKYADLPGIARDEPDVYETADLPEAEQAADLYDDSKDIIERVQITPKEAFDIFKDKKLAADKVDFSDRISKRLRTGYEIGNWELAAKGENETVLQKYNRINCEIEELLEETEKIKSSGENDANSLLTKEKVEVLLKKLADLRLEETLGSQIVSNITDPQGVQLKKLMSQLEKFKSSTLEKPEAQASENGLIFQLNYRPEQAKLLQTTRVTELEQRIHKLETVLGSSNDKLARLANPNTKECLLETTQHLSAVVSLLDSNQLDHIEARLASLTQKMDAIIEKKKQIQADVEKDKMILELYEIIKKSEGSYKLLPQTIERLKTLEALHNKAADFAKSLAETEIQQAEISSNVQNNKALLQCVQESFAINLDEINKTVAALDARIKAIKK